MRKQIYLEGCFLKGVKSSRHQHVRSSCTSVPTAWLQHVYSVHMTRRRLMWMCGWLSLHHRSVLLGCSAQGRVADGAVRWEWATLNGLGITNQSIALYWLLNTGFSLLLLQTWLCTWTAPKCTKHNSMQLIKMMWYEIWFASAIFWNCYVLC